MKIIFDSEEQKKDFIQEFADLFSCPREFELDDYFEVNVCNCQGCAKCWENAIECEVKK